MSASLARLCLRLIPKPWRNARLQDRRLTNAGENIPLTAAVARTRTAGCLDVRALPWVRDAYCRVDFIKR